MSVSVSRSHSSHTSSQLISFLLSQVLSYKDIEAVLGPRPNGKSAPFADQASSGVDKVSAVSEDKASDLGVDKAGDVDTTKANENGDQAKK